MINQQIRALLVLMLWSIAESVGAQTYTFNPPNPDPHETITINAKWSSGGNFVQSKGFLIVGTEDGGIINAWFVQDGANFSPNPPIISASQTLAPGLGAGTYTVNITWVADPEAQTQPSSTQTFTLVVGGPPAPFTITKGITGNWFDPDESGHGFSIEVLGYDMLAQWFVFGPNGEREWIVASGPIAGNTAVLQAWQTTGSGALFPPHFDATEVQAIAWGTLTFTFSDCNSGDVSWQPTTPGYTAGSLPITRLTLPMGVACP